MPTERERLDFAVQLLGRALPKERLAGAAELLELAHVHTLAGELRPHVLRLLASDEPQLRAAGARAVAALGPAPDLIALLERSAKDSDPAVRREALRSLGGLEDRAAIPALHAALRDADAQVRFEAAVGLASLGDGAGVEELLAGVEDKHRRFFALGALHRLGEERAREPARRILEKRFFMSEFERAQAAGVLAQLGDEEGKRYLLDRIGRARADDRGLAMELCGELGLSDALPALRRAMAEKRELFRGTAARSLGLLGDRESLEALRVIARDQTEDLGVRCDAMEALMFLRAPEAVATLHELSASGDTPEVREAANDALAWLQQHPEPAT